MSSLAQRPISILLIDDHVLFRESVARLLNMEQGMEIVHHCGTNAEGLTALAAGQIDIVLLDFDLGGEEGTEFVRTARRQGFSGKILPVKIVASIYDARNLFLEASRGEVRPRRNV